VPATQVLDALPLVDDHCHGVVRDVPDRAAFESHINEGFDAPPEGASHFDTPIGLAVRRWCPPVLDLEPHAPADAYLARRAELGSQEANRRLMAAAGALGCIAYAQWSFARPYGWPWLALSLLPFALWLARYSMLVDAGSGEAPEDLILHDRTLLALGAVWLALFAGGIYVAG